MPETVSALLARIGAPGSFAARRTVAPTDLNLEVEGVGRIRFPITAATARRLCAVGRPAFHGFKDQTRLDTQIRDTWEIPRTRISIDQRRWRKTLVPQLDRIRSDLGIAEGCRLKADLHNLLVYAPGQFFVTHQDSEKTDDMVGTLVVSLPSQFTGGSMVIEHHAEKLLVGGSGRNLTFVAFYADCHHEVRPVKQGYRVVLTYNLICEGDVVTPAAPADRIDALSRGVRDFFATPGAAPWSGDRRREPPDRLVYLLDHQYTQRGLAWNRLKNADAVRAAALREVARQLDCEIFLALADVHETWTCEDEYPDHGGYGRRWGSGHDYDDEDEDGDGAEDDDELDAGSSVMPESTELIDSDVELRHWIGTGGRREAIAAGVDAGELCYTTPSSELEPFESEHEGYMGNWGNTVEHWYHRAAVVLWPRERTFVIRAKASARWAIDEITRTLDTGDTAGALQMAQRLLPFWAQSAGRETGRGLFEGTLKIAAKVDNPKVAAALLQPFTLTRLTSNAASRFVWLLDRYGPEWCRTLLRQWASESVPEPPEARFAWLGSALPNLCRRLCAKDLPDGQELARWILAEQWAWTLEQSREIRKHASAKELPKELAKLCRPMLGLIESSLISREPDLHGEIVEFLTTGVADYPVRVRIKLLRTAHESYRSDALRNLGLAPVHAHCAEELSTRLNTPVRADDDWSITTHLRCSCKLCATLTRFLRAPDKVRFEWPLAQAQRAHVHGIADSRDLPVTHQTRRTGRPYTLVLEKTRAVFERDRAERQFWQGELAWLTKTAADF